MKRDPRDIHFSNLVRCRAEWTCERCGKNLEHNTQGLDCSHLFGRRRRSVRWHPLNAVAHCTGCHSALGENPREFSRWIIDYMGSEKADYLEGLANTIVKWNKKDLEQIRIELRDAWKLMQRERNGGRTGRIEFNVPFVED